MSTFIAINDCESRALVEFTAAAAALSCRYQVRTARRRANLEAATFISVSFFLLFWSFCFSSFYIFTTYSLFHIFLHRSKRMFTLHQLQLHFYMQTFSPLWLLFWILILLIHICPLCMTFLPSRLQATPFNSSYIYSFLRLPTPILHIHIHNSFLAPSTALYPTAVFTSYTYTRYKRKLTITATVAGSPLTIDITAHVN